MQSAKISMLALAWFLILTGCGDQDQPAPTESPEDSPATTAAEAPDQAAPIWDASPSLTTEPVAPNFVPPLSPSSPPAASLAESAVSPMPAQTAAIDAQHLEIAQRDINAGLNALLRFQNTDGGWGRPFSIPAITALAIKALVQHPDFNTDSPAVSRGLEFLLAHVQNDGGIYSPQQGLENYNTSVAVMALVAADSDRFRPVIRNAVNYLRGIQIVDGSLTPTGETVNRDHPFFGGTSYGEHGRPDLSNLGFTMQALHEAGVPHDDPFFENALIFLARVQNRSESNDQPWAAVVNDGGFIYSTARSGIDLGGESKADVVIVDGRHGLRSYGSMTYTGFKSMLYARVDRNDPRVQAAYDWIRRHWRLDSNPNMPAAQSRQGLYYYYHVFARALRAWGQDIIVDSRGLDHNWRHELIEILHEFRQEDGIWVNSEPRWFENMPELVTAYAVLALQEALLPAE